MKNLRIGIGLLIPVVLSLIGCSAYKVQIPSDVSRYGGYDEVFNPYEQYETVSLNLKMRREKRIYIREEMDMDARTFYLYLQRELIIKQNAYELPGHMTVIEYYEIKYSK